MLLILAEMLDAVQKSTAELKQRITDVELLPYQEGDIYQRFKFFLDGAEYHAELKGRNQDLCLGFGAEQDKAIACRVFLDGDAKKI